MSKAFVRAETSPTVGAFSALLPKVKPIPIDQVERVKLGRTAEGLQKLREQAQAEGRDEGYHEGFEEGQREAFEVTRLALEAGVNRFREALDQAAERIDAQMAEWYREAEVGLAGLAVAVAAQVLGRELTVSPDTVTEIARKAIREIAAVDKVRIRINPFDAKIIAEHKAKVLAANPSVHGVEIVEDPAIEGGVRIESDAGMIDATIRTQLELAFEALRRSG